VIFSDFVWVLWFVVATIFFVIEILTPTFFVVCFGVGALAAMIASILTGGKLPGAQLAAFAFSSFAAFLAIRPLARKIKNGRPTIGTNVNSLIDDIAIVVHEVGIGIEEGEIRIRGDFWRAVSADGRNHLKDELVKIDRQDGTLLYVRSWDENKEVRSC
jgi:membrane protein implicated in regulation of membrane protease activity